MANATGRNQNLNKRKIWYRRQVQKEIKPKKHRDLFLCILVINRHRIRGTKCGISKLIRDAPDHDEGGRLLTSAPRLQGTAINFHNFQSVLTHQTFSLPVIGDRDSRVAYQPGSFGLTWIFPKWTSSSVARFPMFCLTLFTAITHRSTRATQVFPIRFSAVGASG